VAAALALLATHNVVYVVELGPTNALETTLTSGEHAYWPAASLLTTAFGLLAAAGWSVRILWLRRRARLTRGAARQPAPASRRGAWLADAARTWLRLAAAVLIAFLIQENIEHAIAHHHVVGFAPLLDAHLVVIPALLLATGIAAAMLAFAAHREADLLARILAAAAQRRAPRVLPVRLPRMSAHASGALARHAGLRAPPQLCSNLQPT